MGIEIVKTALVLGRHLPGTPFKVLIAMSLQALDKPKDGRPASLYFAGWEPLALVLGYENCDRHSAGEQAVKRAVSALRREQHITPLDVARIGTRQTYLVHPGGVKGAGQKVIGNAGQKVTGKSRSESDPGAGQKVIGLGHIEDQLQDLLQDTHSTSQPGPKTARDDEGSNPDSESAHKFEGHAGDGCLTCGGHYTNRRLHPLRLLRGTA